MQFVKCKSKKQPRNPARGQQVSPAAHHASTLSVTKGTERPELDIGSEKAEYNCKHTIITTSPKKHNKEKVDQEEMSPHLGRSGLIGKFFSLFFNSTIVVILNLHVENHF